MNNNTMCLVLASHSCILATITGKLQYNILTTISLSIVFVLCVIFAFKPDKGEKI